MTKPFQSLLIFLFAISFGCKNTTDPINKKEELNHLKFSENILDYRVTPKDSKDKSGLMFSDQGAWFAYSFPDSTEILSSFSGPFLMTQDNGIWSSPSLSQLLVKNSNNQDITWSNIETNSYNSHLEQVLISEKLNLKQELVFSSGHTALIKSTLTNISKLPIAFSLQWKGQAILAEGLKLTSENHQLNIHSSKSNAIGHILFRKGTVIKNNDSLYNTIAENIYLKPNETKEIVTSQTFIFSEYSWKAEKKLIEKSNFDSILSKRKSEKNAELKSLILNKRDLFSDNKYSEVVAKANLTLQNNWRIPAGEIKHEGLFPSYHYKWFNGFWSWDSWKHAVGLSYYNTDLAKKQIKLMFEFQDENGFVADCVFRDTLVEKHNYRDTKPPLSAWAVVNIFEKDTDLEFTKLMYPKLKKYHEWWYLNRDHDQDGLCEYGSTDGSLIAAKWESGMDNAIRFDNSKILQNADGAYSLDQESVDLNAYLYAEKLYLSTLASALHKTEDVNFFEKEAKDLKKHIQSQFYDSRDGWFYDTNLEGNKFIKGEGSEGWTALWANAASQDQAEAVKNNMMNPTKFYTKVPFQTMSADHEKFNPLKGYWRGPNWLDQAYFGVKGLRNYGFNEDADNATIQILEGADGVLGKGKSIRENYHPISGEGLNAQNFSWSAAHIIMLLMKD
ncbi:MAG: putative isomerase [bacterium]|jgi:putative isomerase